MRVLFWSAAFFPTIGGVEVLAAKLLSALQERGHAIIVIAPKAYSNLADHSEYNGIPVYRLSFRNNLTESTIDHVFNIRRQVLKLKEHFAPDLVHINAVGRGDFFHLTTNIAPRVPSLVTLHGQWETEIEPVVRHTLRNADWIAGCSRAILDRAKQLVPEIHCRSSVIYNAVEPTPLRPKSLPFDPPRILCLGRLALEKGFDLALAAFVAIVNRFPSARLIVAGNGPLRFDLERQAHERGIAHAVDFIGWVAPEAVPPLINASTIVLMPSRHDSMPLVALEAALIARPVIATNVGGLPEIIINQRTGLLVDKENPEELAKAMKFLLDRPKQAVEMGQAARHRVQRKFNWKNHVDYYDRLYRRLSNAN